MKIKYTKPNFGEIVDAVLFTAGLITVFNHTSNIVLGMGISLMIMGSKMSLGTVSINHED